MRALSPDQEQSAHALPFCGHDDTQVKDSRPHEDGAAIRRRRICGSCGQRFTTIERVQLRDLVVIKADARRVPFERDKLARSVKVALRKRPVDAERIERIVNGLVRRLEAMGRRTSPRAISGGWSWKRCAKLIRSPISALPACTGISAKPRILLIFWPRFQLPGRPSAARTFRLPARKTKIELDPAAQRGDEAVILQQRHSRSNAP